MKRIGGLWLKEGKNGKFFSGNVEVGGIKQGILIFRNDKKEGNQPDYNICEAEEKKEGNTQKQQDIPF